MTEARLDFHDFHWIDLGNPTPERLQTYAEKYELHPTSVQDCLQPEHLPKFERIGDVNFAVLRAFDRECTPDADTVQELTRKVAIFYSERFVLTIHRKDQSFLDAIRDKWSKRTAGDPGITPEHVLIDVLLEVLKSYEKPVMECLANLEIFEMEIFGTGTQRKFRISKGYYLKRKVSVYKRLLRATGEPMARIMAGAEAALMPHFQNARELSDGLYFYCDEISESLGSLLSLHISLASQKTNEASRKTNEVVRVLTIFSCFFLPINFIASLYGMNFKYLPEADWEYGYYFALLVMLVIVIGIYFWFRRKGWLKEGSDRNAY